MTGCVTGVYCGAVSFFAGWTPEGLQQHDLAAAMTTISDTYTMVLDATLPEHARCIISDTAGKSRTTWTNDAWTRRWDATPCRLRGFIPIPSKKRIQPTLTGASQSDKNRIWQVQTQHEPDGAGAISFVFGQARRASTRLASGPKIRHVIDPPPQSYTEEEEDCHC